MLSLNTLQHLRTCTTIQSPGDKRLEECPLEKVLKVNCHDSVIRNKQIDTSLKITSNAGFHETYYHIYLHKYLRCTPAGK